MKVNEFRGAVYSRFPDASAFADKLGWNRQKLSYIMTGKRVPRLSDIQEMATALNMDVCCVASFFLQNESQKCDELKD